MKNINFADNNRVIDIVLMTTCFNPSFYLPIWESYKSDPVARYEVLVMNMVNLDKQAAEIFFEVLKLVLPAFAAVVDHITSSL